jgi:hypothetical protein
MVHGALGEVRTVYFSNKIKTATSMLTRLAGLHTFVFEFASVNLLDGI